MKVVAYQLETVMDQLKNYVAKTDVRPALVGIHIVYEDGVLTFEATDSYIMSQFKIDVEKDEYDEKYDLIIEPFKYKAGNAPIVELNLKDLYVRDFATGKKTAINVIDAPEYPNLDCCYPTQDVKGTFSVTVEKLLNSVKGLSKKDVINFEYRDAIHPITMTTNKNREMFKENRQVISLVRSFK